MLDHLFNHLKSVVEATDDKTRERIARLMAAVNGTADTILLPVVDGEGKNIYLAQINLITDQIVLLAKINFEDPETLNLQGKTVGAQRANTH